MVNMVVVTKNVWRDRGRGQRREKAEFHRVTIFHEGLAKLAAQHLKKGARVYLEGELQTRRWDDDLGRGDVDDRSPCAGAFRIGLQSGVHVASIGYLSTLYRPSNGL